MSLLGLPTTDIAARMRAVHALGRVRDLLRAVALDAMDPTGPAELDTDEWQCVCDIVEGPVDAAAAAAVEALTRALDDAARATEPGLAWRLEMLRQRAHLGVD